MRAVGDNPDSATEMGVNVQRVRILTFVFMGLGAALAGVFSTMVNYTWWPTTGDGYLLPAIASVFVGGTPTWGGVGTIAGGAIGALIVSFIQSGIVAAGLSGFYVQFFNGLDHHPVAAGTPLEPEALPMTRGRRLPRLASSPATPAS